MIENDVLLAFIVFFPIASAFIGYAIGKKNKNARNIFACVVTAAEFLAVFSAAFNPMELGIKGLFAMGINFQSGGLRSVLMVLAAFVWLMSTLFSNEYFAHYRSRNRYYFFMLATLGATMGVFLSADFYTTLIFFEIMSFTSWVLVMHDETENALRAGMTYLTVAVIGGLVTLVGMFFLYHASGTMRFDELSVFMSGIENKKPYYIYGLMVLTGFAAKAGAFPLHIWLPEAHPVAPAPASALLSCVLTKTGIFGVLVLSTQIFMYDAQWGLFILITGTITMFLGAFLAVFSINLKRTLACSSLSQIGFILVGIGMQGLLGEHNAIAAGGTILHIVNHSVIKMTLFLCAGTVYMNIHELDLNKIRGWGRNKPLLKIVFLQGLLGIGGIPLWGGYISKTLLHESIVEYITHLTEVGHSAYLFNIIEWIFLISGGLTLAYMTKLFVAVFIEKAPDKLNENNKSDNKYLTKTSAFVLICCGVLISVFGLMPNAVMGRIADVSRSFMNSHYMEHEVHYFAWVNLKGAVISIAIGAAVYFGFIRTLLMTKDQSGQKVYTDVWPKWLSIEKNIYRPVILTLLPSAGGAVVGVMNSSFDLICSVTVPAAGIVCEKIINPSFEYTCSKVYYAAEYLCGNVLNPSFENIYKVLYFVMSKSVEFINSLIENIFLWLLIIGVIVIRFFKGIYDYMIQVVLYLFFNYDEISYEGKRNFRKDAYFSRFSVDKYGEERGMRENLSVSLILFGLGVVIALIYLII